MSIIFNLHHRLILRLTLLLAFIFVIFPSPQPVHAATNIVINEFSSATTSDWVELYNSGSDSVDLSTYKLYDSTTNDKTLSGTVASGQPISFSFSNYLNKAGDKVRLIKLEDGTEITIDEVAYGDAGGLCAAEESGSIGRKPDGSSSTVRFASSTRDASNNTSAENPCPTPTPTSSPTSQPTTATAPTSVPPLASPTIKPTATSSPTSKPAPKPTPTAPPAETDISTQIPKDQPEINLDIIDATTASSASATPTPVVLGSTSRRPLLPTILMILGGLLTLGFGIPLAITEFRHRKSTRS